MKSIVYGTLLTSVAICCCGLPAASAELSAESREWTAASGAVKLSAKLSGIEVVLSRSDNGKTVRTTLDKLSDDDLRYLSDQVLALADRREADRVASEAKTEEALGGAADPPLRESPEVTELLSILKSHPVPEVRVGAAKRLGEMRVVSADAVEALMTAIRRDTSTSVRDTSAEALGLIKDLVGNEKRVCALLQDEIMGTSDDNYRGIAADALIAIDGDGPYVRKVINSAISSRRVDNYLWALERIQQLGREGQDVQWVLSELLRMTERCANTVLGKDEFAEYFRLSRTDISYGQGIFTGELSFPAFSNRLLETMENVSMDHPGFRGHLEKYSRSELPAVSRDNPFAESL